MNTQGFLKNAVPALVLLAAAADSQGALTDLAEAPLVTSGSTTVRPNLMYVLDDSGSMDRDVMPDWADAKTEWLFRNSDYNSIAYNPAITYTPPVKFKADGTVDATAYPSQTAANTDGWTNVKFDGYGVQPIFSTAHVGCPNGSTTGLVCDLAIFPQFGPRYYLFQAGEYCKTRELTECHKQDAPDPPGGTYLYPAPLRWCKDILVAGQATPADYACRAARIESGGTSANVFASARHPRPNILTLNFSGSSLTSVTGLMIGTTPIIAASTAASNNPKTVAGLLVNQINLLTTATGYGATCAGGSPPTCSSGAITITAYVAGLTSTSDVHLDQTGAMTVASSLIISNVPGKVVRVDILPTNNSYPDPLSPTGSKAPTRTDCAGATCTYDEEMTNYANWWAYYHTRMQMMKSSSSLAFAPIDSSFRVGYLSINNGTGSDFLNIRDFDNANKSAWYNKFLAAEPSGITPLRTALTKAGRMYGGKLNGSTLNGSTVVDPIQYSCQQNFTLLSTDGYWNEPDPGGYQLNGTTAVGNQDGTEVLPMKDGLNIPNTLSDVAEYYFKTDLRPAGGGAICTGTAVSPATTGSQLCPGSPPDTLNDVPVNTTDTANWQHMTTYTLGLGASGYMRFDPSYETGGSADFDAVKNETAANPANGVCAWQGTGSGVCKWPRADRDKQSAVDDLWHASINGRGAYFNARNPADLVAGLTDTLQSLTRKLGASAAAVSSNPNITASDNLVFSTTFTTSEWSGQLIRQRLDPDTGLVPDYDPNKSPGVYGTATYNYDWTAQAMLDARPWAGRVIKTFDPISTVGGNRTKNFEWDALGADQGYFKLEAISSLTTPTLAKPLSQFCIAGIGCLTEASQSTAAGQTLVDFLRGDRSQEGNRTDASKYFRQREHVLGDIVNAETVYVAKPLFSYFDPGYKDSIVSAAIVPGFASLKAGRNGTVYVAANDGMLHAFDGRDEASGGGTELWAYIPRLVLPKLYRLADKNYPARHEFLVDGTPVVFDICPTPPCAASDWKTILVGGLGRGGRGYYALDVTDPGTEPKVLWEFTDPNMGYSYGNPIVTKDDEGNWVVVVSSGYNNVPDSNPYHATADGKGRIFVLNAHTGALLKTITTPVGTVASPSGLSGLNFWLDDWERDNTAKGIYGGDLLGNLWRFDINAPAGGYQLLATFKDALGNPQPITAKPELGEINDRRVIFVGTGRLLGVSDLADTSRQSFYAVKDPLTTTGTPDTALYPDPRSDTCSAGSTADCFVQQTETIGTCPATTPPNPLCTAGETVRTSTNNAVNFSTGNGWFLDLPETGERANTDPVLVYGTLVFNTNVPNTVPCTAGGYSNQYLLDYRTGGPLWGGTNTVSSTRLGDALASRPVVVALPNNEIVSISQLSDGTKIVGNVPITPASNAAQRSSWRELIEE